MSAPLQLLPPIPLWCNEKTHIFFRWAPESHGSVTASLLWMLLSSKKGSFTHSSFNKHIIEHLLSARHCARYKDIALKRVEFMI